MPKKLALWVVYTQIANNILEEVFEDHPDIVTRAIVKLIKESQTNAKIQEEDSSTYDAGRI